MRSLVRALALGAALLVPVLSASPARAQSCAGFNDVFVSDAFCTDVTWLKNGGVTLGCTGLSYCPTGNVTRAQMALFMRRLAEATFQDINLVESSTPPSGQLAAGVSACTTQPLTIPASGLNGRRVHINAIVSMRSNASADVRLSIVRSDDGGPFNIVEQSEFPIVTVPTGQWVMGAVMSQLDVAVAPGTSSRWRIDLQRAPGGSTGEITNLICQLKMFNNMNFVP
jgi:hypothetical protein